MSLPAGSNRPPWYTPYIVADLTEAPWPVQTAEHSAVDTSWKGLRQASKAQKMPHLPFLGWILCRLRFISAADICQAWLSFGGLSTQLNRLSSVLHLSATESIPVALLCDQLLSSNLGELARQQADRAVSDTPDVVGLLSDEQQRFKLMAIAQSAMPPAVEKVKKEKEAMEKATKERKVKDKATWVPRREFLARLEADRQRAQTADRSAKRSRSPSKPRERPPVKRSRE